MRKENVYLLPEGFPEVRGLRFMRTGLYVGELKKKRFEPSQALAMYLKQGDFKQELNLPAGDERLIRYLKGKLWRSLRKKPAFPAGRWYSMTGIRWASEN
ncbi:MAG: RsmF rRNA methyltransferase first C-terminal domain-containing protein [Blautia sp.]